MKLNRVGTWIGAIAGGVMVFVFGTLGVMLLLMLLFNELFQLLPMFDDVPAVKLVIAIPISLVFGFMAARRTILASVRNPGKPAKSFRLTYDGLCPSCSSDQIGNASGRCTRCGHRLPGGSTHVLGGLLDIIKRSLGR